MVRVRNDSCYIPKSVNYLITDCYGPYSELNEDKEPFGLRTGTEWTYSSPHQLGSYSYTGDVATYGGGGYYIDLMAYKNQSITSYKNYLKQTTKETLKRLYDQNWPDRGMRALFLDFTTYNVNVNLFCFVKLVFEFTPTGGIITSSSLKAQKLLRYNTHFDFFALLIDMLYVIFTVYFMCLEIYEMYHFKRDYFKLFWNWIDLILVVLLYIVLVLSIYKYTKINMELIPLIRNDDIYSSFDAVSYLHSLCTTSLAVTVFFAWLKLLKYLTIFNSMNELQKTVHKASNLKSMTGSDVVSLFKMDCRVHSVQRIVGSSQGQVGEPCSTTTGDKQYSVCGYGMLILLTRQHLPYTHVNNTIFFIKKLVFLKVIWQTDKLVRM